MKSTKIYHTSAAVILKDNGTEGIIYDTPPNTEDKKSIYSRLKGANNQAQNLYSLFNTSSKFSSVEKENKFCTDISKKCSKILNGILKKTGDMQKQKEYFANLPEQTINIKKDKIIVKKVDSKLTNKDVGKRDLVLIHKMVEENLRKAFCRKVVKGEKEIDIPTVVEKLVIAIYHMKNYKNEYENITEDEMTEFLNILNKDYFKKEQLKKTENSIKRQNVKSQKFDMQGDKICISNANHDKKKYLFEFLKQIVSGNLEETEEKKEFEELLALFYLVDRKQNERIYESKEEFCIPETAGQLLELENKERKIREDKNLSRNKKSKTLKELDVEKKKILNDEIENHYIQAVEKVDGNKSQAEQLKFIADKTKDILIKMGSNNKEKRQIGCLCRYVREQRGFAICTKYIKKLIVLFFYGSDKYNELKDTDIAGWGFKGTPYDTDIEFSEQIAKYVTDKFETKDKKLRREINSDIKAELRRELREHFSKAAEKLNVNGKENDKEKCNMDKYWLRFINDKTEELLLNKYSVDKERKRKLGYLCEYIWNEWAAFVCGKFIDLGKGVYHFAMPDVRSLKDAESVCFGNLLSEYENGITSFDYERIQAEEDLDRDVSVYISFAINNFGRAVCTDAVREKNEDVLTMKLEDGKIAQDAKKKILQYFGGQSQWEGTDIASDKIGAEEFVLALRGEIANVRNRSFHYTGIIEKRNNRSIILEMFNKEYGRLGEVYRKKYHSNGVPMFYSVENINNLMNKLYGGVRPRTAQVPCFQRIVKRNDLPEFVRNDININESKISGISEEDWKKYMNSLYFLLKEIYYYGFQQEVDVTNRFWNALEAAKKEIENHHDSKNDKYAMDNFYKRVCKFKGKSFGEICRQIMIDYELQNNKEIYAHSKEKGKYEQYPILLCQCIRRAFISYLKNKKEYKFLKNPENLIGCFNEGESEEAKFCTNWNGAKTFEFDYIESNPMILSWYVTAHFMNPKHLNHLIGSIRSYICYVESVESRAGSVNMKVLGCMWNR